MIRALLLVVMVILAGCAAGGGKMDISGKKILMVVAFEGFRDEECFEPKKVFEDSGANVTIASSQAGTAKGKLGGSIEAEIAYSDANPEDYDAVVFAGGPGAAEYLDEDNAKNLAKNANSAGKIVAAICIAPSILANAGLLEGKKATAFSSEKANLESKGAVWQDSDTAAEGNIVTGNGPGAAAEFGKKIVELLS